MSVEAFSAVLHHSTTRGTAKLVLLGIANHATPDGIAWPTARTLCVYAGYPDPDEIDDEAERRRVQDNQLRALRRVVASLIKAGELTRDVNQGGTPDRDWWERPNLYRLHVGCPETCDGSLQHRRRRRAVDNQRQTPGHLNPGGKGTPGHLNPGDPRTSQPGKPSTTNPQLDTSLPTSPKGGARPVDNERPPRPAHPPADELAAVRRKLAEDTARTRGRGRGAKA